MNTINRTAQLILLVLIIMYIAGFFMVPSWQSYLAGSAVMYVMCTVVLNKMQQELKQMQIEKPTGDKPKGQWRNKG